MFLKYSSLTLKRWYQSWNQDAVALTSDWKQKKSWMGVEDSLKLVLNQPTLPQIVKSPTNVVNTSASMMVLRTGNVGQLRATELALEFFYWLQNYFFSIIRVEIKDSMWRIYFPQKLILLQEFELLSESENEVIFIFRCRSKAKKPQKLYFTINHFYLKNRKFAFLTIKNDDGPLGFFTKKLVIYLFNRFNQYLLN